MKITLSNLVNAINKKGYLGSIGLANDGETFIISNDDIKNSVSERFYGKLLPNGIFDIEEIIYDSAQITDILADNYEDITEYLEKWYDIKKLNENKKSNKYEYMNY